MIRLGAVLGIGSPLAAAAFAVGLLLVFAATSAAADAKDGRGEVRVEGVCGSGGTSQLRLKRGNDGIELRFEVEAGRSRPGVVWRVVLV